MRVRLLPRMERLPLPDQVYATVLDGIVSGALPAGASLCDGELAAELGISRPPVREALRRLEEEGLVQSFPGAAPRVVPLDVRGAREAVTVIAALHAVATHVAVPRLTMDELNVLRRANNAFSEAVAADDILAAIAADDEFHEVFVFLAANGELQRTLDRLMPRVRRLLLARLRTLQGRKSARQHEAIIEAAARGDVLLAAELVGENWLGLGHLLEALCSTSDADVDVARRAASMANVTVPKSIAKMIPMTKVVRRQSDQ